MNQLSLMRYKSGYYENLYPSSFLVSVNKIFSSPFLSNSKLEKSNQTKCSFNQRMISPVVGKIFRMWVSGVRRAVKSFECDIRAASSLEVSHFCQFSD